MAGSTVSVPLGDGSGVLPRRAALIVFGVSALASAILSLALGLSPFVWLIFTGLFSLLTITVWSLAVEGRRRALDRVMTVVIVDIFILALVPLGSLIYTVVKEGTARFDGEFLTSTMRGVLADGGGALHAAMGTFIITAFATLAAVPVGVMAAIYLVEYGKGRLKRAITFFVDVMMGIPSIVAGLFAFALFSIFLGPGIRLGIMGSVALMVLMIPIVIRSAEEMLRVVPDSLREASFALGVPKWITVLRVVLPTALAGIVTGVMLSIARVIGETAPLLITTGSVDSMNLDPFNGRMANLPVYVYEQYKFPGVPPEAYIERAWAGALLLIIIVMVLFLAARLIARRYGVEIRR
ncbi:MAG: phosphate ABC transporter permease PstA [Solirubrobacterales bacterium]|nr:phosphate ABC transporter permease PstA [Solirubrobacterales bacterium]MCB0860423.1 phosphate ABC transporter permease PstA [Solirubrobacterales bacterium]